MFIAEGDDAATAITTGGTFVKVAGTTTPGILDGFTHTDGRLTFNGPKRRFNVSVTATNSANLNGAIVHLQLNKSGTLIAPSEQHRKIGSAGDLGNMSCPFVVELENGDYIELWATTELGQDGKTITCEHCVLTIW